MPESEHELQLEVWKELAVSKQLLMWTAAKALKLDPDCTEDELREAVEKLIRHTAEAEASATSSREQARKSILEMEHKVASSEQARQAAENSLAQMRAFKEKEGPQLAAERAAAAKELKKAKDQLAEKEKAIKAITTALADSPENVVRKLKELRKQKQEESDARKVVESSLNTARHEKREAEQKMKTAQASAEKLAKQHREIHALTTSLHEQLKPLVADAKGLPVVPELDTELLDGIAEPNKTKDK